MLQSTTFHIVNIWERSEFEVPILQRFPNEFHIVESEPLLLTLHQCTHSLQLLQKQMPLFNTWAILTKFAEPSSDL